jgi:hypothetical protein
MFIKERNNKYYVVDVEGFLVRIFNSLSEAIEFISNR